MFTAMGWLKGTICPLAVRLAALCTSSAVSFLEAWPAQCLGGKGGDREYHGNVYCKNAGISCTVCLVGRSMDICSAEGREKTGEEPLGNMWFILHVSVARHIVL